MTSSGVPLAVVEDRLRASLARAPPLERAIARLWPELMAEAARFRAEAVLDGWASGRSRSLS